MSWVKDIPLVQLMEGVPVLLDAARADDPDLWERGVVTAPGEAPGMWWVHGPTLRPQGPHPEGWYIIDLTRWQGIAYAFFWVAGCPWMPPEVIRYQWGMVMMRPGICIPRKRWPMMIFGLRRRQGWPRQRHLAYILLEVKWLI